MERVGMPRQGLHKISADSARVVTQSLDPAASSITSAARSTPPASLSRLAHSSAFRLKLRFSKTSR
eukprot:CAMPEP_0195026070 /NCGR_PEP_ID=MMETSP0326_2-20130528/49307_1 /TAXON_ID=2866 ORGANISM="Crypthecodinium cohnii, Strain Seligo" /NCGR_SAMPLE_ID=MMETSP0326_2 /ASSEMBLY_ACC=CAM_ASM_000348 /LENGTH=65 /DNA_ID=CAMNT_0040047731 /DNA_START=130 /DNA_END=324 /DNA_ORIENTATION=+